MGKQDPAQAVSSLEETIEIRRALLEADPRNVRLQRMQIFPHLMLGEVLADMHRGSEAVGHFRQAIAAAEPLANSDAGIRGWIARAYSGMGDAEEDIAKRSPVASPARLNHHQAACASNQRAAEQYRANARHTKLTKFEADDLKDVLKALRSCPP
jgi:hypothetical protein